MMRSFSLVSLLSTLIIVTTLSAAWPWPPSIEGIEALIVRRQDSSSSNSGSASKTASASASATATATNKKSSNSNSPSSSATDASSSKGTVTDKTSSSGSGGGSAAATTGASGVSGTSNSTMTSGKAAATTNIDPRLPPGGVEMVTPSAIAGSQYYKIGDFVTFAWNYTSLSVTPTAIDVLASCSINSQPYTIAMNQSVQPTGAVTWDTGNYQSTATVPLLTETYTLVIYDAAKDVSATAQAGYLGVYDQFTFGMYVPQKYTPLNEFKCATCSSALSDMERHALGFMLGMGIITVLSFTWFAGGFGVFS